MYLGHFKAIFRMAIFDFGSEIVFLPPYMVVYLQNSYLINNGFLDLGINVLIMISKQIFQK